ncbi:MAG: 2-oxoacid:acceptor oxidoreductase subunit alpha [Deltaproteobacteria bacterium]|nr:2-oxoacid:acceptor oxidoreductase subunit alpha [Deltaproteobacteria bacterium]
MECSVKFGGAAGQGLLSLEIALMDALARLRYHFFATKNYMSRIRGGHNFHMIRIADRPVHALSGKAWEIVVALDEEAQRRHKPGAAENGIYLSPVDMAELTKVAGEDFGDPQSVNTIVIGIVLSVIGCSSERAMAAAAEALRPEVLKKGLEIAEKRSFVGRFPVNPRAGVGETYRFDGNQALAYGAILGGCQFMAGYPMTPATSIMNYFSRAALEMPLHFEQAEDEIGAVNMALGASYAGVRSMVATSGGGFSLMAEGLSLAGMTETPIVIIVAQRPGPSTGLPTRTEQGDVNFLVHAGQGEFPRVVYAPGSIGEAISLARKAFELADTCQIPLLILTDQYFADSVQVVEEAIPATPSSRLHVPFDASYRRYALAHGGISPLTCPGLGGALVKVDSDEHDEEGLITEDLDLRKRMVKKRMGKREHIERLSEPPVLTGDPKAETVLVSWGSNRMIAAEAVQKLVAQGKRICCLHFGQVYPLYERMVAPFSLRNKRVLCLENNATGQFAGLLKRELGIEADRLLLKYNGECFTVAEICGMVLEGGEK